jgi:hypothetical protein
VNHYGRNQNKLQRVFITGVMPCGGNPDWIFVITSKKRQNMRAEQQHNRFEKRLRK